MAGGNSTANAAFQGHCGSTRHLWSTAVYKIVPMGKCFLIPNEDLEINFGNTTSFATGDVPYLDGL